MYRMIVMDLDDTLLGSDLKISRRNREAVSEAVRRGVLVTLATGRMYRSARPYALSLNLNVPLITDQGAVVRMVQSGEELLHQRIELETALEVIDFCERRGIHLNVFIGDDLYVRENDLWTKMYVERFRVDFTQVDSLKEFVNTPPTKLLMIGPPEDMDRVEPEFRKRFTGKLTISRSTPNFLSLAHPDSSKGKALGFLAEKYGIEFEEIIAVGDSLNDLDMLEIAGLACVVGNARPELKEVADYVAASCDEDGVAEIIEKFILKDGVVA